jgi:hypothetical protein
VASREQRAYRHPSASLECNFMLENPIILAALICFLLGLVLSGFARILPGSTIASAILTIIFLASYVLTYQQVPDFPPIGATNKIFYIALAAALIGFALDLLPRPANYRKLLAVIMPLLIVGWIGFPRFAKPDIELMATVLGLWLGGAILLWRLETVATTPAERNGGSIVGTAMLISLMLAFAPVALLGGSSTSLMLCLAMVAGLAAVALWELVLPRGAFGASAVFGVGGGLLAMIDTVTLITRQVDLAALALLLLIPYAGEIGARLLLPPKRFRGRVREVLVGTFAALPILLVIAVLFLHHPESLS